MVKTQMGRVKLDMSEDHFWEILKGLGFEKVVHCKVCKYYTGYECQRSKVSNIRVITEEDDYCSRAEKKE